MARGRKKLPCRDIRREVLRPVEAMKFLSLTEKEERFFYRLVEEGYISRHEEGYYLGEVLQGFILACSEKRLSIRAFLCGLSDNFNERLQSIELEG